MIFFFLARFCVPKKIVIKGNVEAKCSCIVRGKIEGSLHCSRSVHIKKGGVLEGNLHAKKVKIRGAVWGDVHANKMSVFPGGYVRGKIIANKITVHENGLVEDVEEVQSMKHTEPEKPDVQTWF